MQLKNPVLVVTDMEKSVEFYKKVLDYMLQWILERIKR